MKDKKRVIGGCILLFILVIAIVIVIFVLTGDKKVNVDIKVHNYYSLSDFYFDGDFNEFYRDSYKWYKTIENEEGVYLVNTSYYSDELLDIWEENNLYTYIPDNSFWYFTVSPSYLKQMNINLSEEEINSAISGVRLYLIPDTLSEEESIKMTSFLKEDAIKNVETSSIETTYTKNQEVKVITYMPDDKYFTFPSSKGEPVTTETPILYVCTSENMRYFESESLISTGVDSYVKFIDKETMEKCTNDSTIEKYSLKFVRLNEIYKKAARAKSVDFGIESAFE